MGDRALVVFKSKTEVSPVTYLHWYGEGTSTLIKQVQDYMKGREGDVSYTAARFIGICHENISGNISLRCWSLDTAMKNAVLKEDTDKISDYSRGDAGFFVVDIDTFKYTVYGGYAKSTT